MDKSNVDLQEFAALVCTYTKFRKREHDDFHVPVSLCVLHFHIPRICMGLSQDLILFDGRANNAKDTTRFILHQIVPLRGRQIISIAMAQSGGFHPA